MNVGIMTFPNSESYGAVLQMFALCRVCETLGCDTEVINYHNLWMKGNKHFLNYGSKTKIVPIVKKTLGSLIHLRMKAEFKQFENQIKKYPRSSFYNKEHLESIGRRYGAVICGSDQVWNPDITNYDLSYFLDFCTPETSRISYAPSFGVEDLPESYAELVDKELKKFDALSVREEAGKDLIREISGLHAELVVDPTLLLTGEQWQAYEKVCAQAKGEYILYYTIRSSKSLWEKCLELAKKTNMKILRIGSNVISKQFKKIDGVEYVCDVGPAEWLWLVHNASYIVTNSFHGTAFSINYRKNFYVEFSSLTNSRLANIVNLMGLEDRVLEGNKEIIPSFTDYSKTEAVLPVLKEKSTAFLEEALRNASSKWEGYHAKS